MDGLDIAYDNQNEYFVRRATQDDLPRIIEQARVEISESITSLGELARVCAVNRDTAWMVGRSGTLEPIGFYLLLYLNDAGLAAYREGVFDTIHPDIDLLVESYTRPAAVYVWGAVARGLAARTIPLLAQVTSRDLYGGVPLLAKPATKGGVAAMRKIGFGRETAQGTDGGIGDTFRLDRPEGFKPRYGLD